MHPIGKLFNPTILVSVIIVGASQSKG